MYISCGYFGVIAAVSQVKLPHRGSNNQQTLVLSFCPSQWGGTSSHIFLSNRRSVWVVVSAKSCSSTGNDSTWLNRVVWGHLLVDPRWIAPKPWTTSQWLKVTYSHTVSLSSTILPAKGWRSRLLGRLSFSAQYCRPSHRQPLGESVVAVCLDMPICLEGRCFYSDIWGQEAQCRLVPGKPSS